MSKKVFYDEDARRRVLEGAKILYEAVKTTMRLDYVERSCLIDLIIPILRIRNAL